MRCPKCNYIDAGFTDEDKWTEGDKGNFYSLPIEMKRPGVNWVQNAIDIHGCPNCGNVFIDV